MELLYVQRTGNLYQDGVLLALCYAGFNGGLNNPEQQSKQLVGPLPVAWYTLGHAIQGSHLGPNAIPLKPDNEHGPEMFGRASFYMHLDNASHNQTASRGCIVVLVPSVLAKLAKMPGTRLQVIAEKPEAPCKT